MLELARFRLELRAEEAIVLPPYKGSALRGGFGATFKKVVCALRDGDCSRCMLRSSCAYSYIFETPPPPDARMMRKYPYAPHPFVLEPPLEDKTEYAPGEVLSFGLVLVGRAIEYLPYFLYTFGELGRIGLGKGRGRFSLKRAWAVGPEGEEVVYEGEMFRRPSFRSSSEVATLPGLTEVSLSFLTPTRIKYSERLVLDLEFHILVRSLLRRISLLSYFHCGRELKLDFRGLIDRARDVETAERDLRWYDWERYSGRQKVRMKLGGFVGRVSFRGELEEFWPLLVLGQEVHVGKGTSFGLGWYRIEGWNAKSS